MSVRVRKIRGKRLWSVKDANGKVHAKGTTFLKASRQANLLNRIHKNK